MQTQNINVKHNRIAFIHEQITKHKVALNNLYDDNARFTDTEFLEIEEYNNSEIRDYELELYYLEE